MNHRNRETRAAAPVAEPARQPVGTTKGELTYLEDLTEMRCQNPQCQADHDHEAAGIELCSVCCGSTVVQVIFDHPTGELRALCPKCDGLVARFALARRPVQEQ